MTKPNRKRNIRSGVVICGAYGMGNAGDEAILDAIVDELRSIDAEMPITVLTRKPPEVEKRCGVNAIHMFNVPAFLRAMKTARLYINGGGSLIQDITSTRSLWYYLFTIISAKRLGCKVMMYGCGIGPVGRKFNRKLVRRVINKNVDTVTLREPSSEAELKSMGVSIPKIILSADPVFSKTDEIGAEAKKIVDGYGVEDGGSYIGFCLRKWTSFSEKAECFAKAADYAFNKYGLKPVFIPVNHPSDSNIADEVIAKMSAESMTIQANLSNAVIAEIMRRMKVVVSIRLHGLIFAVGQARPIVGVSYDPKVTAFLGYIGQENITELEDVSQEILEKLIDSALASEPQKLCEAAKHLASVENRNKEAAKSLYEEGYN